MRTSLSLGILAALIATAAQAQQPDTSPCVIVFSKGQNMSGGDPKVNEMWNRLNDVFGQFVSEQFKSAGKRVVAMPHPVEATDTGINTDRVLKRARQEGCDVVVGTSMYADQQTRKFMSSLRANPIVVTKVESPAGTNYTVGKETFRKEQADPLSKETLDRLAPSAIAKNFVEAYLAEAGRP